MSGIAILCVAILTIVVSLTWGWLLFRADTKKSEQAENATFQHDAQLRSVDRLRRSAIPFDGKVKQQIRVVSPPRSEVPLRVVREDDVA